MIKCLNDLNFGVQLFIGQLEPTALSQFRVVGLESYNYHNMLISFFLVRFARTWPGLGLDLVGLESHNYHKMLKKNLFIGFTETRPCGYCIIRARVQIFWHSLGGHTQLLIYTH